MKNLIRKIYFDGAKTTHCGCYEMPTEKDFQEYYSKLLKEELS